MITSKLGRSNWLSKCLKVLLLMSCVVVVMMVVVVTVAVMVLLMRVIIIVIGVMAILRVICKPPLALLRWHWSGNVVQVEVIQRQLIVVAVLEEGPQVVVVVVVVLITGGHLSTSVAITSSIAVKVDRLVGEAVSEAASKGVRRSSSAATHRVSFLLHKVLPTFQTTS